MHSLNRPKLAALSKQLLEVREGRGFRWGEIMRNFILNAVFCYPSVGLCALWAWAWAFCVAGWPIFAKGWPTLVTKWRHSGGWF